VLKFVPFNSLRKLKKTSVAQKAIRSMAVRRVCRRELTNTMAGLVGECDLMAYTTRVETTKNKKNQVKSNLVRRLVHRCHAWAVVLAGKPKQTFWLVIYQKQKITSEPHPST
jgi:hypothetical protein